MFQMNLQLFAHKKGMGSSKNGRDSHAQRLGTKLSLIHISRLSFIYRHSMYREHYIDEMLKI